MKSMARVREIGPVGRTARVFVGAGLLAGAFLVGRAQEAVLLGGVVIPTVVTGVMLLRGLRAKPLRAHEPYWHCVNIGIGVALFAFSPAAAFLFYGGSMLIAAWRGLGACELLAVPNLVLRRNDQLACPLFLPVDAAEARSTGRDLYCSD